MNSDISPSYSKKLQRIIYLILTAFALLILFNSLAVHYTGYILLPLIKTLLLTIICVIYGAFFQICFKHKQISLETSFSLGLIATTCYFFILGFLQQVTIFWFSIYIFMAVPAGIFLFLNKGAAAPGEEEPGSVKGGGNEKKITFIKKLSRGMNRTFFELKSSFELPGKKASYAYLLFLFPLFYAVLPSSFFDTLVYHLGIPNLYIQNGGFCAAPQFLYANTSIYYEISLIPAVFMGNLVPRFFHLFMGMVLIIAVINFARDFMGVSKSRLLLVLIITIPMSAFLLTTVKNDLAGALFILSGIRGLLEKRFPRAGLFWGFAVGIKYFNALPVLIFLVLFLIDQRKFPLKQYFYFSLTFLAVLLPLLGKNLIYSGNPVFPFFNSFFPADYWDESRARMMARDVGRICRSWRDFIRLPYDLSFKEFGSGGRVGVQFLVFLPFWILGGSATPATKPLRGSTRKGERVKGVAPPAHRDTGSEKNLLLFLFSIIAIFAGSGLTGSIRFLYLPFLILSALVVRVYEKKNRGIMKVLMIFILLLNSASSIALLNYLYNPHLLYTQNLNRDEYIALTFPAYPAVKYLNLHTPKNSKVLIVGETRNYYLHRPYKVSSAIDYSILKPYLEKADNLIEWFVRLRADGIDYMLVNLPEFKRLHSQYKRLSDSRQQKALAFFAKLAPVFQHKGVYVFQVK